MDTARAAGVVVGIDLGTTFSAVARMDERGHVEVIPNSAGAMLTPSVVFFDDDDNVLVGREAVKALTVEPGRGAECFKRDMGFPAYRELVDGRERRPESLSAIVLAKLKQDTEAAIGPISGAVITVPAFFDDTRRKATEDAGRIAGLNVLKVINEPTAAALWYGFEEPERLRPGEVSLVYDLGGGTFDVTLMRGLGNSEFETLVTDGNVMLGGRDWDERLLAYVAGEFEKTTGLDPTSDRAARQELLQRVEECKRTLSKLTTAKVAVSCGDQRLWVPVTRECFEGLTADLLARTKATVELLVEEAGLGWRDIARVILVGGSSHMPMVQKMLERLSGRAPEARGQIELAVARGAAVYAAALMGLVGVSDDTRRRVPTDFHETNSHSLGVEIDGEDGRPRNSVIIPRNTPIPCQETQEFRTASRSGPDSRIPIVILEGEAADPEACVRVGTCEVSGLPSGLPSGSVVRVTFAYSGDGRITVEAEVPAVSRRVRAEIARSAALTESRLQQETSAVSDLVIL